jgi:hypothetical protein
MSQTAVHTFLLNILRKKTVQITCSPETPNITSQFASHMCSQILEHDFLIRIVYTGEATFHVYGRVNRHNCAIRGSELPRELSEYEGVVPKVQVWCARTHEVAIDPFFL